jgi:hypothetical protein
MGLHVSDQNKVGFYYESGTYGVGSSALQWFGLVQNSNIDSSMGIFSLRFAGNTSRNVNQFVDGPVDYTATVEYYPQDFKMLGYALGSSTDTASGAGLNFHRAWEVDSNAGGAFISGTKNLFNSFTLYDGQASTAAGKNKVNELKGCVINSFNLTAAKGEIVTCSLDLIGQSLAFSSGALVAQTAATTKPFRWNDVKIHMPSGTVIDNVTDISFTINNNLEPQHYLNGSVYIANSVPMNRDYELTLTMNSDSEYMKPYYDQYFMSGITFNAMLDIQDLSAGAGSRNMFIIMSGCKMMDMENPTGNEGINTVTMTIAPQTVNAIGVDTIVKYNPW